jgi:hypothetical protein
MSLKCQKGVPLKTLRTADNHFVVVCWRDCSKETKECHNGDYDLQMQRLSGNFKFPKTAHKNTSSAT